MRQRTPLLVRGLATSLVAMGLLGATALPVAAEEICSDQPVLALVDADKDGLASVGEIRSIAPDNAELQATADQLDARGVTGIRYTGCDDSGGSGTDDGGTGNGGTGDGGAATGGGDTGGSGTGDSGAATGDGGSSDGGAATGDSGAAATGDSGSATGDGAAAAGGDSGAADTGNTASIGDAVISGLPSVGHGASSVGGWNATMVTLALGAAGIMALGAAMALRKGSLA